MTTAESDTVVRLSKLQHFFVSRTKNAQDSVNHDRYHSRTCDRADCSSYNLGIPLGNCVRIVTVFGCISSILYIIAGTSLITYIVETENIGFSTFFTPEASLATTRHIYYKKNVGFFIGIATILVILSVIQLLSDVLLFITTLKIKKGSNSLWIFMVVDIALWIMTLICFITIFSGSGLFLLLVFLLGTAVRAYITFVLHEYMGEQSKIYTEDQNMDDMDQVSTPVPNIKHFPIPEEPMPTLVEHFPSPQIETNASEVKVVDEDKF